MTTPLLLKAILRNGILLYRVNKWKFSKFDQTWHGSSPQIAKLYGENGRSVSITVLELWHFLHSKWPFYIKFGYIWSTFIFLLYIVKCHFLTWLLATGERLNKKMFIVQHFYFGAQQPILGDKSWSMIFFFFQPALVNMKVSRANPIKDTNCACQPQYLGQYISIWVNTGFSTFYCITLVPWKYFSNEY